MTAERAYRTMIEQESRGDVLQAALDELVNRGVTDTVALGTLRAMRNAARRRAETARLIYRDHARQAYGRLTQADPTTLAGAEYFCGR